MNNLDWYILQDMKRTIRSSITVGVVGAGTLGIQIASHLLYSGCSVVLKTRFQENIVKSKESVERLLSKYAGDVAHPTGELKVVTKYSELWPCSFIIEAVPEDQATKLAVLEEIEHNVPEDTDIYSNTSSISIEELASGLKRPERFLGFHLFNPVRKMNLVEIIIGPKTGEDTLSNAKSLAKIMEKDSVTVNNSPGFIVNRLLLWQINEAARMVSEGVSSIEDIDKAVRLGLNHPMGPFQLADLIGLDVCLSILRTLDHDLGLPGYTPSPLMESLVREGRLGKKTSRGFYTYEMSGH